MKNVRSIKLRGIAAIFAAAFALSMTILPQAFAKGTANLSVPATQAKQDFELHNETGLEITEVHISETGNDNWEEDILGQDTLETGSSVNIKFGGQKAHIWDLKIVFSNGKSNFWRKLDLSQLTDLTISFKDGQPVATWKNGDE